MNPHTQNIIMKIIKSFPTAIIALGLSNCGSNGKVVEIEKTSGYQASHGPFDSKGNYIESWADNAPKRKYVSKKSPTKKSTSTASSSSTYTPKKTTPKPTYTPKKTTTKPTYTPKPYTPKTTAKKITPKSKPPIIHKVSKGDTLYGIARKYGASISDIQTANSISGTSISIGKQLIIPRK